MSDSAHADGESVKGRKLKHVALYAAGIIAVSVSLGIRYVLSIGLSPDLPTFLFFCPAVIVVAFLAGLGPGLAATGAAVLETALLIYPARHLSVHHVTGLVLLCVVGVLASAFAGFHRRASRRTFLRKEESALKLGEAHFSTMFHASPVSMSLIRMSDGKCYDVNQAHGNLFGFTREEAVGRTGQELGLWVDPHDRERFLQMLSRGQGVNNFEAVLRRKQGDIVTTLLFAEVIRLEGEQFLWMIHNDITERKRTEEKFRRVVESAPTGLIIVDSQSRIVLVNAQAEKQFGYPRSELVGSPVEVLIPETNRLNHKEYRREYFADPQPRAMGKGRDLFGRRKDGSKFPVEIGLTPIEMGDGTHVMASVIDITERKRAEDALRESEARLKKVLEVETVGVMFWDLTTGALVDANDTFLRLMGYSRSDVEERRLNWQDLTPPEYLELSKAEVSKFMVTGRVGPYEKEYLRKDGTRRWLVFAGSSLGGNSCVEFCVDISDRKNAEAALQESVATMKEADIALRTLVDSIPGMVLLMNTHGVVLAANETIARQLGMQASEMIGRDAYERLPSDVAKTRRMYADQSVRSGESSHYEDSRLGRSFENYMYPIKDGRGNVTRLAVLSLDITERKKAEAKMKEQAALLDIASDAILRKDLDDRILYWNKGAENLYGWTAGEATGKKTFELLYSEDKVTGGKEALRHVLEEGEWRGELHQKTKEGEPIIVEARWTLIRNDRGQPSGILSVKTDITAKRSIEAQLLRSQRLESLGTLAGGIAHDLNNVLAPILMGIEGLSFRNPDASVRSILSIIKSSAQRGANIVRQILNFARGMEGDIGEIQLKHVLREVEDIIRETFPKSIALKTDIAKDLWPVNADATQLHQVLMNLCVNARDAMPNGGGISVSAENASLDETYARMNIEAQPIKYVVVKVEDTGTGMAPGVLERIFDPFFTTKEPGKGTGLGLSTVHSIVKSHGGFVTVYSELNKGTSFKVYIPAADQGLPLRETGPEEGIPAGLGETILLVDDEVSLRDISRQILESYGYRVVTAADGTEAVARFVERKKDIRLVITDMMMPYMDGANTIRAIRRIDPRARIIATSGLTASEDESEARGLGVQAFLAKPYTAEKLLHTLREALDREDGSSEP